MKQFISRRLFQIQYRHFCLITIIAIFVTSFIHAQTIHANFVLTWKHITYFTLNILSPFSHKGSSLSLIFTILEFVFINYCLWRLRNWIWPYNNRVYNQLANLGHVYINKSLHEKKKLKISDIHLPIISFTKNYIDVESLNQTLTLDQVKKNLESYETLFNVKITEVTAISQSKSLTFRFILNRFSEIDSNIVPVTKPFHLYLGKDSQSNNVYLELEKQFSLYIGGTSGSGKTSLIKTYIHNLKQSTPDLSIILFDAKLLDYDEEFIKKYNINFFPMITNENIIAANAFFDEMFRLVYSNSELLRESRVNHAERLHEKGIKTPLPRTLLIMDEAGRYLKSVGTKEQKEEKKKLINHVTNALAMLRANSTALLISSQRFQKNELEIDWDNFQSLLINGVSKEMSNKYADGLVSATPTKGKWFLRNDSMSAFIKTPFSTFSDNIDPQKSNIDFFEVDDLGYPKGELDRLFHHYDTHMQQEEQLNKALSIVEDITLNELLGKSASDVTIASGCASDQSEGIVAKGEILNSLTILRTEPSSLKYKSTHEVVSIESLGIKDKLVLKGLTDQEILKKFQG